MTAAASRLEYKIWWIPQIPMKAFEFPVSSVQEGKTICNLLALYDAFQFENNIKPDYCNTGGVLLKHPIITENEWWSVPDDDEELNDILAECHVLDN